MEGAGISGAILDSNWQIVFDLDGGSADHGVAPEEVHRFYGKSLVAAKPSRR